MRTRGIFGILQIQNNVMCKFMCVVVMRERLRFSSLGAEGSVNEINAFCSFARRAYGLSAWCFWDIANSEQDHYVQIHVHRCHVSVFFKSSLGAL